MMFGDNNSEYVIKNNNNRRWLQIYQEHGPQENIDNHYSSDMSSDQQDQQGALMTREQQKIANYVLEHPRKTANYGLKKGRVNFD